MSPRQMDVVAAAIKVVAAALDLPGDFAYQRGRKERPAWGRFLVWSILIRSGVPMLEIALLFGWSRSNVHRGIQRVEDRISVTPGALSEFDQLVKDSHATIQGPTSPVLARMARG